MPSPERSKGRRSRSRFAQIPRDVLVSHALASADHAAFRVLVALAAGYNGHNNGSLALTREQAREFGILSHDTLGRGLAALESRGLIVRTCPGSRRPPTPSRFALTWRPTDDTEWTRAARTPSREFASWAP